MDPLVLSQLLLPGVDGVTVLAGLEEREFMYTIIMVCMGYRETLSHIEHTDRHKDLRTSYTTT